MNSLKNLMIIAVLAALGYGVYVSLQRNNVDSGQASGDADGWPAAPKVELPSHTSAPPPGGPLALGESAVKPADTAGFGSGVAPPPTAPPLAAGPTSNLPSATAAATPATPYPSSAPPPSAPPLMAGPTNNLSSNTAGTTPATSYPSSTPPPAPPLIAPSSVSTTSSTPSATLGPPIPSDAAAAAAPITPPANPPAESQLTSTNPVRNLDPPSNAPPGVVAPPSPSAAENMVQSKLAAFMEEAKKAIDAGKFAEAHLALSQLYGNPDLPAEQAKQIATLLDQLAGTVIYSRQHHLERPYVTQSGDTIDRIAQRYSVPWQLLARINGLMPPGASNADTAVKNQPLPVGRVLKVVRGPFDAVVHLDRRELMLMVGNRYAGRFAIGIGRDQPKLDGEYTVCNKTLNPTYYGPDGINIGPNDPKNPLGGAWIGLTDRIGIHGTSDPQAVGRDDNRGVICTSDRDLQDLYGILSVGSRVTILR